MPRITPAMQSEKRSSKRKTVKRGRKPKKGGKAAKPKAKAGKGRLGRKSSKRDVLKAAKSKKSKETSKVETLEVDEEANSTPKGAKKRKSKAASSHEVAPKAKAKAKASTRKGRSKAKGEVTSEGDEPKVHQERVGSGKRWRYQIVEGQYWGCSNCRYIFGGCAACKKPTFRGKRAQELLAENSKP